MTAVTLKDIQKKDALRKRVERETQKYILPEKDMVEKRERERVRKQLQRMKKKMSEDKTEEEKHLEKVNDLKRKNEKLKQRNHRLKKKSIEKIDVSSLISYKLKGTSNETYGPQTSSACPDEVSFTVSQCQNSTPEKLEPVSKFIWKSLTPRTKKKTVLKLASESTPTGFISKICKEIGLNLSNLSAKTIPSTVKSQICLSIENFFYQEYITRICPDTNKMVKNPHDPSEKVPVRYRLGNIRRLYMQYCAEDRTACSHSLFCKYVPYNVIKLKASDWGTCLCGTCLNSELKVDKLVEMKLRSNVDLEELFREENLPAFIQDLDNLKKEQDQTVLYNEWQKIDNSKVNASGKKGNKILRKVTCSSNLSKFVDLLKSELETLRSHLQRVHAQKACIDAESSDTVTTIHIDWSENSHICQAKEEKAAYYHEDNISLHAMRVYEYDGQVYYLFKW